MYIYYKQERNEEHMLYANEIALLYNFFDINNKPRDKKVHAIIRNYIKDNNLNYSNYYYNAKNGLKIVYPRHIFIPAMSKYLKETNYGECIKQ